MRKNIVITGASRGVGAMLAKGLAAKGNHVICLGRNEELLNNVVDDINTNVLPESGKASYEVVDMMQEQMVVEVGKKIKKDNDHINVWINNVGVNNHNAIGPTWELSPTNWWTEVSLNLYTAFIGTQIAIQLMKARNAGYIINLGGGGVQEPKPYSSAYGAAKSAVVKFTEAVNMELKQEGLNIKLFAFNPGFIRNTRTEVLVESDVARKYMPKLEQILKYGKMSDIKDSIDLVATIINGKADMLSGKYFFADEKNINKAIANSEEFVKRELNVLRVNTKK